jgi:SpoVK/Ycf46/Vps4 family AAA+-type ATPase
MTTNRESVIDKAVKSRAHLTINYPALDHASRRQIWSNFLSRGLDSAVSDEQLDKIADVEVDGRRIRNVVKTAGILASQEGRGLSFEDIKDVFRVTERVEI